MLVFSSMIIKDVTSFSHIKNYTSTPLLQSKFFLGGGGEGFFSVAEGYTCFRRFLCVRIKTVLLTSDLLPNISLVVCQSSVNISLTLRTRHIYTSRLPSNQSYTGQQITVSKNLLSCIPMLRLYIMTSLGRII